MSSAPAAAPQVAARAPLLEIRGLTAHYVSARGRRVVAAVRDVSLALCAGEALGIVGESGSGKSTLALAILRMLPPAARIAGGEIRLQGEDLLAKSEAQMREIRGKRIAMILQDPLASLNPLFAVGEQVAETIRAHERASRREAWSRAEQLLEDVRIPAAASRMREHPHQLSGGTRQRVVGAIALSCAPQLLVADEPTTSLDLTIQAQYLRLLGDLQRSRGLALIFITHNLGIVAKMCDRLAVMYAGRIVEAGPVQQVFDAPAHPYTQALLESMPRLGGGERRLLAIDGQPPDLAALGPGCAFAPRCRKVSDRCRSEDPPARELGPAREARCWHAG